MDIRLYMRPIGIRVVGSTGQEAFVTSTDYSDEYRCNIGTGSAPYVSLGRTKKHY